MWRSETSCMMRTAPPPYYRLARMFKSEGAWCIRRIFICDAAARASGLATSVDGPTQDGKVEGRRSGGVAKWSG